MPKAMEAVTKMYENYLKTINPGVRNISYDIKNLYTYIDRLPEMAAMVMDSKTGQYAPRGKNWIKQQIFNMLKGNAKTKNRRR